MKMTTTAMMMLRQNDLNECSSCSHRHDNDRRQLHRLRRWLHYAGELDKFSDPWWSWSLIFDPWSLILDLSLILDPKSLNMILAGGDTGCVFNHVPDPGDPDDPQLPQRGLPDHHLLRRPCLLLWDWGRRRCLYHISHCLMTSGHRCIATLMMRRRQN